MAVLSRKNSLSKSQIRGALKENGFNQRKTAKRWGFSEHWVSRLIGNSERSVFYDDAFRGLPKDLRNHLMTPDEINNQLKTFKVSQKALATRWEFSHNWVNAMINNTERREIANDAIYGFLLYCEKINKR